MSKKLVQILFLIIVCVVTFSNNFKNEFLWDDHLITDDRFVHNTKHIPDLIKPEYWRYHFPGMPGQYRPLRALTFMFDYSIWKKDPFGYHLTSLILHILNVIILYFFISFFFKNKMLAFLTSLLFAVHPVHVESVTWMKNRTDLLCLIFYMLCLMFYMKYTELARNSPFSLSRALTLLFSILCFILALLSKEMAVSLPIVLTMIVYLFSEPEKRTKNFIKTIPFWIIEIGYIAFLFGVVKTVPYPERELHFGLFSVVFTLFKTIGHYIKVVTFPVDLCAWRELEVASSILELDVLLSVLLVAVLLIIAIRYIKINKTVSFTILWVLITLLPVANIKHIPAGRPFAEQRLYIPSVGFCIIIALIFEWFMRQGGVRKRAAVLIFILLSGFYSLQTINRNRDWKNGITLWSKTAIQVPNNYSVHTNLGVEYLDRNQDDRALQEFETALRIYPYYSKAHTNIGNIYLKKGMVDKAIEKYKQAINLEPDNPDIHYNLAVAYGKKGWLDMAEKEIQEAVKYGTHPVKRKSAK
ncbi:MAG: tetratricopeptide repeat protein [Elusimicrobia bacterium]|nr:tetratricopeptide repeat protein [Elusimicrobiota bacterium]